MDTFHKNVATAPAASGKRLMAGRCGGCIALAAMLVSLLAGGAKAQTYSVRWSTVDGGGTSAVTGANFSLAGTAGQPDAGVMTGSTYRLLGGFWPGPGESSGSQCSGSERIKKAKCKNKQGSNKLTVKLIKGAALDTYAVELSTGEKIEGVLNKKGKAKVVFEGVAPGGQKATATWGCGAEDGVEFACP